MIITTTNNIEGLAIRQYLGIVSGTEIYLVGGLIGGGLVNQEGLYTGALRQAMARMEEKARQMDADAIVGVSTNFTSPGGLNSMIVAVTGTAVRTEAWEQAQARKAKALEEAQALIRQQEAEAREDQEREQARRREQLSRLSSGAEGSNPLEAFLREAALCGKSSEVLALWEAANPEPGALTDAMDKKIRATVRTERLYGAAAGNVPKLLESLCSLMQGVEE